MKKVIGYTVQARKGSWFGLGTFKTREDADNEIEQQEMQDRIDGNYEPNYYTIVEVTETITEETEE